MCEEMTHGRSRWAGGLVEVDRSFLRRNQHRERRRRLRHRGPELALGRPVSREHRSGSKHSGRSVLGRPPVKLVQSFHGGGYLQCMERRRISSAMPLEQTFGYTRARRRRPGLRLRDRAGDAGRRRSSRGCYGQARRCLEIILAALAEAGAGPEDVVGPASTSRQPTTSTTSEERTVRCSETCARDDRHRRRRALRPAVVGRDRSRGDNRPVKQAWPPSITASGLGPRAACSSTRSDR